ncbi:hypothetical protein QBC32DRAFT_388094, partial [Pseudoneurospora amorphoporcata]
IDISAGAWGPYGVENWDGFLNITVLRKIPQPEEEKKIKILAENCLLMPAVKSYNLIFNGGNATFASKSWRDDSLVRLLYLYLKQSLFDPVEGDQLGPNFDDPMDDIINSYREMTLRMSVLEAAVSNENITSANTTTSDRYQKSWINQSVDYVNHQVRVEYKANPPALGLAVVISLLGPLATLTLFWGYWKLGRDFFMSPLELANAFLHQPELATLLANCSSNASAKEITKHCAHKRNDDHWWNTFFRFNSNREPKLQYGVLESTGQLGFAVEDEQGIIHARKPR